MTARREFEIAFVGLKEGLHEFNFKIDRSFFENLAASPILDCDISVLLKFDKKTTFFLLDFQISGIVKLNCNRCNAQLDYPIDGDYPLVVKLGEVHEPDAKVDEDVIFISRSETHLNVEQLLYEFIVLTVPAYVVECSNIPGKSCDPEVLKILNDLNQQQQQKDKDPRWDTLKNIKFK
jgi:uncharacterized metal-binding protein YceD (DUF177 family)